jgi:FkbM family methyltransferase
MTILSRGTMLRRMIAALGWTVHRWPANRFDAMEDALTLLGSRGYAPKAIVDVGANRGTWTDLASRIFPHARFHLVEPQRACAPALVRFSPPRFRVHHVAVTGPDVGSVRMIGGGPCGGSTSAWVADDHESGADEIIVPASTLDDLLSGDIDASDRALLKLDIEGHELSALGGAGRLLSLVEVVVCEVQFFSIDRNERPVFADVLDFMRRRSFELYDFGALAPRPRDRRLRMGDAVFVRSASELLSDLRWT